MWEVWLVWEFSVDWIVEGVWGGFVGMSGEVEMRYVMLFVVGVVVLFVLFVCVFFVEVFIVLILIKVVVVIMFECGEFIGDFLGEL